MLALKQHLRSPISTAYLASLLSEPRSFLHLPLLIGKFAKSLLILIERGNKFYMTYCPSGAQPHREAGPRWKMISLPKDPKTIAMKRPTLATQGQIFSLPLRVAAIGSRVIVQRPAPASQSRKARLQMEKGIKNRWP